MYLHFILLHGLVHMSAFCIFCRLVVIQVFTRSFLRREFWSYIEFPLKQKVFFFFFRHKELLCYRTQRIMFRLLLNKHIFQIIHMTIGQILQTASKHENNSDWVWWILFQKQMNYCWIKTRKEFYCSICMWREMMKDSDLLLRIFFPHSSRKFQSFRVGLIYFSFSFQSFVQKNQHSGLRKYKYLPNVGW